MGMVLGYFHAPDDAAVTRADARPGGVLGLPVVTGQRRKGLFGKEDVVESLGPAFRGFHAPGGFDPMVTMGTLEAELRGVEYNSLQGDPRWGGSVGDAQAPHGFVMTLTDTLAAAVVGLDDEAIARVSVPWSRTEGLAGPPGVGATPEDCSAFIRDLRELARSANAQGHRLYCHVSA